MEDILWMGFLCGSAGKESACNVGDLGSIPGLGRSPGEGKGYPLQFSDLKNSMGLQSMGLQRVGHNWMTFILWIMNCPTWSFRTYKFWYYKIQRYPCRNCFILTHNRCQVNFICHSYSSSVQSLCHVQLFETPWTAARQASLSITNSRSLPTSQSRWWHPTISSSDVPFSHLQYFPASGSFQMSQFFTSGGQSIGVSVLASVLPMNIQNWFPLEWTDWISLQSKGL